MTIEELANKFSSYGPILTFIGQIIIALVAITIAILGETMKTWIRYPDLKIMEKIDCIEQKVKIGDSTTNAFYYRLCIKNFGRLYAEKIEVFAKELLNSKQEKIESFISRRFKWTNTGQPICDIISPDTEKYCELLHFVNPFHNMDQKLDLDLEDLATKEFSLTIEEYSIKQGTYYLVIQLTSANSKKPVEKILQINNMAGEIKIDILNTLPRRTDTMIRQI